MEGISHEAASLAGTLGLGKLIFLYDDNLISLDGPTELSFTEDVEKRFEAYHWHVQRVADGNDLDAISKAIEAAKAVTDKPSMIAVRTVIGYGSPKAGTNKAHGEALKPERRSRRRRTWAGRKTSSSMFRKRRRRTGRRSSTAARSTRQDGTRCSRLQEQVSRAGGRVRAHAGGQAEGWLGEIAARFPADGKPWPRATPATR